MIGSQVGSFQVIRISPYAAIRFLAAFPAGRGVVILIVIAVHSALAYLQSTPARGSDFNQPPYNWRSLPIVDSHRFFGFDLFCAWQDIYLMSLLFFLSGLFIWPSLSRKKERAFLRDRVLRLGLPYLFGVAVLMPLTFYP